MSNPYPPLAEVRNTLKINWYRSPVERATLRELTRRSNAQGFAQTLGHLFLFLATGTLTYFLWTRQIWIGFAVSLFLHGTVASYFLGVAPHELAHGTVFRTKWLNKAFMYLFSTISMWNHFNYALSHTYHHRYTLHPEGDREVLLPIKPNARFLFLLQLFTVNLYQRPGRSFTQGGLISTFLANLRVALGIKDRSTAPSRLWVRALHEDQPKQARKAVWWARWLFLFHAGILAVSIITGNAIWTILITVAPFTANAAQFFTGIAQHSGMRSNDSDFRKNSRSMRLGPILEFLYWRMNWHAEHHMYAAVPCYHLKKLYRVIAEDMPEPRTLSGAWKEMRETWKRQQTDPGYEPELPVPTSAASTAPGGEERENEIEKSIGDLAPEELR